jgi:hypothetical protein
MHQFDGGGGGQGLFPAWLVKSRSRIEALVEWRSRIETRRAQQYHQRADALAGCFGACAFARPAHVVGQHFVVDSGVRLIQTGDLFLQFAFNGGQHLEGEGFEGHGVGGWLMVDGNWLFALRLRLFAVASSLRSGLDVAALEFHFQLLRRLEMDGVEAQLAGGLDIFERVVNEQAFARWAAYFFEH